MTQFQDAQDGWPHCYWCNRQIAPDDVAYGLVTVKRAVAVQPRDEWDWKAGMQEPRIEEVNESMAFHFVCLSVIQGNPNDNEDRGITR
jgi:hypothetical protein